MAFGGLGDDGEGGGGTQMAEINMVPLIDVMLVLLIVFMVTAPLMTHRVDVDLPRSVSHPANEPVKALNVSIGETGTLYLEGKEITLEALEARFQEAAQGEGKSEGSNAEGGERPPVHLHADQHTDYGRVAEVMAAASRAGLLRLGFVSEPR